MAKSYKEKFRDEDGVWRTIGGRRVFIRKGQSLSDAMIESGKFGEKNSIAKIEEKYKKNRKEIVDKRQEAFRNMGIERRKNGVLTEEYKQWEEKYNTFSDELAQLDANKRLDTHFQIRRELNVELPNEDGLSIKQEQLDRLKDVRDSIGRKNDTFEVGDLKRKALETLPKDHIDSHEGDLYIKKTPQSTELLNRMKDKDSGLLSTFKDQQTGEEWYDVPFANMSDDYKEKYSHAFPFHEKTEAEKKYADDVAEYFKGKDIKEEIRKVKAEGRKSEEAREILKKHDLDYGDSEFNRAMLGRMESDIKYYLGNGSGYAGHLWAKDEDEQINIMKALYNTLPEKEKPDWINETKIEEYSKEMKKLKSSDLKVRFKSTYDYMKNNTTMSEAEILEYLRKLKDR